MRGARVTNPDLSSSVADRRLPPAPQHPAARPGTTSAGTPPSSASRRPCCSWPPRPCSRPSPARLPRPRPLSGPPRPPPRVLRTTPGRTCRIAAPVAVGRHPQPPPPCGPSRSSSTSARGGAAGAACPASRRCRPSRRHPRGRRHAHLPARARRPPGPRRRRRPALPRRVLVGQGRLPRRLDLLHAVGLPDHDPAAGRAPPLGHDLAARASGAGASGASCPPRC